MNFIERNVRELVRAYKSHCNLETQLREKGPAERKSLRDKMRLEEQAVEEAGINLVIRFLQDVNQIANK